MDIFWILHLTMLVILHQASMHETSSVRGEPIMAAPASASGATDVTNSLDKFMCLCIKNAKENATHCYRNITENLVVVEYDECYYYQPKYQSCVNVYKSSDMLCICMLTTVDGGAYAVRNDGKEYTFKLQKSRKLAEPTLTCKPQNCSHESCFCGLISSSTLARLKQLNCTAPNSVKSESITVTSPRVFTTPSIVTTSGVLCNANATVPPSTGANSGSWIWILVLILIIVVAVLLIFFVSYCKSRDECGRPSQKLWATGVTWMRRRCWISVGSQDDSHGAAGDMDTQAESSV